MLDMKTGDAMDDGDVNDDGDRTMYHKSSIDLEVTDANAV